MPTKKENLEREIIRLSNILRDENLMPEEYKKIRDQRLELKQELAEEKNKVEIKTKN